MLVSPMLRIKYPNFDLHIPHYFLQSSHYQHKLPVPIENDEIEPKTVAKLEGQSEACIPRLNRKRSIHVRATCIKQLLLPKYNHALCFHDIRQAVNTIYIHIFFIGTALARSNVSSNSRRP